MLNLRYSDVLACTEELEELRDQKPSRYCRNLLESLNNILQRKYQPVHPSPCPRHFEGHQPAAFVEYILAFPILGDILSAAAELPTFLVFILQ